MAFSALSKLWESKYGMKCSEPVGQASTWSIDCRYVPQGGGGALYVRVQGNSVSQIVAIEAIALQYGSPDVNVATRWLEGVAALPYNGSEPDRAVAWLRKNIATGGTTHIAGVDFHVYGSSGTPTLEITAPAGR